MVPLHQRLQGSFRQRGFHVPIEGVDGIHLGIHATSLSTADAPRVFETNNNCLDATLAIRPPLSRFYAVGHSQDKRNGRNDADDLPDGGLQQTAVRANDQITLS